MFYTNDVIYHRLLKEKVRKIERGVIENRDERDCLILTQQNRTYYLDSSFFDKYSIDKLLDEDGNLLDWDVWKAKKSEAAIRKENRLRRI